MEFRLTEEQEQMRDMARKFATTELPELARRLEDEDESVPAAMVERYASQGFLGINLPEKYGGHGLTPSR